MNKLFLKIATLTAGVAMAIGVGVGLSSHKVASFTLADTSESVDFSAQGYTNQQAISSYSGTSFSVAFDKGTNSNAPKYYTSGTAIRAYGGNTFTVSSSQNISQITLSFGTSDGSNAITTNVGTYVAPNWSGSATSVTFTIGGTSGNRRLAGMTVYFGAAKTDSSVTITNTKPLLIEMGDNSVQITAETSPAAAASSLTYASSKESVATISANGTITPVSFGTTIITVSYAGSDTYNPSNDSIEVTIINPNSVTYKKVSKDLGDYFEGDYLIVYEDNSLVFDGSLDVLDVTNNNIDVTIVEDVIATQYSGSEFHIAKMEGGYSIQSYSGKYIGGKSGSNEIVTSDSPLLNTIEIESGNVHILSNTSFLAFNSSENQMRFRYYKDGTTTAKAIQLYKKVNAESLAYDIMGLTAEDCAAYSDLNPFAKQSAFESTWEDLSETFALLSDGDKTDLANADAKESSESIIEQAMARYDFITAKYHLDGFITGRSTAGLNNSVNANNAQDSIVIIVIVSCSLLLCASSFILLKKKRSHK